MVYCVYFINVHFATYIFDSWLYGFAQFIVHERNLTAFNSLSFYRRIVICCAPYASYGSSKTSHTWKRNASISPQKTTNHRPVVIRMNPNLLHMHGRIRKLITIKSSQRIYSSPSPIRTAHGMVSSKLNTQHQNPHSTPTSPAPSPTHKI